MKRFWIYLLSLTLVSLWLIGSGSAQEDPPLEYDGTVTISDSLLVYAFRFTPPQPRAVLMEPDCLIIYDPSIQVHYDTLMWKGEAWTDD